MRIPDPDQIYLGDELTDNFTLLLGYEICVTRSDNRLTECQRDNKKLKSRAVNGNIVLNVPRDVAQEWCARYSKKGKPIHRSKLLSSSDYEIVMTFNREIQGLLNYYALAHNIARRLSQVRYMYLQSMVKTLAAKHKQSSTWVYRRYTRKLEDGRKAIAVTVPRDPPKKPLVAMFGPHSLARDSNATLKDHRPCTYLPRTELVKRLLNGKCELCGSVERIEVHHVRKLADVRKKYHGRKSPQWVTFMLGRRRKTVVVCQSCHRSIHAGTYDGAKLN